jgi:hypothetical protein
MQIQILAINKIPAKTSKGDAYNALEIAFKNLTFQGKIESKKLTPYGTSKPAYDVLANAQPQQVFDITIVKDNGFNNWTAANPGQEGAPVSSPSASSGFTPKSGPPTAAARTSNTYETPEERAKKQVYIIRQSSLATAERALSVGAKSGPKASEVIAYAQDLEAYVFSQGSIKADTGFDDLQDDLPN